MHPTTRRQAIEQLGSLAAVAVAGTGLASATEATADVNFEDQTVPGAQVMIDSVTLPDGGWVVLHDPGQDFAVIGHSGGLDPGTYSDVNVAIQRGKVDAERRKMDRTLLAMAHRDTGEAGEFEFPAADPPYPEDGNPVVDPAAITFR